MISEEWIRTIGLVASLVLPLWNIPLIIKLEKRKSSRDLSLSWTLGVWTCLLFMLPAGLLSPDPVFRIFAVVNLLCFSGVVFQAVRYRRGPPPESGER